MNEPLSIFDLDHTLVRGNTSFQFYFFLIKKGYFSKLSLLHTLSTYARHKYMGLSIEALHRLIFRRYLLGKAKAVIDTYVQEFIEELSFYPPAYDKLKEAEHLGHHTVILSSSPDFLVGPIADKLGVDEWRASTYGLNEFGQLAEIKHLITGREKAKYIEESGRAQITAYSDSIHDLPMLLAAHTPIAVNPDKKLAKKAATYRWPVL